MTPREKFAAMLRDDRVAAINKLARSTLESFDDEDFAQFWCDINNGTLPETAWRPMHVFTDEQLVDAMADLHNWPVETKRKKRGK